MRIERTRQIVKDQPDAELRRIGEKILNNERILSGEGILLFESASLGFLGALANYKRELLHGDNLFQP
jgi:aminodeoxyfutalosine synthase